MVATNQKLIEQVQIDWITEQDLAQVTLIANAAYDLQRAPQDFFTLLKQERTVAVKLTGVDRRSIPGLVGRELMGYMIFRIQATRYELLELAVDRPFFLIGVGTALVEHLMGKVSPVSRKREIVADVHHGSLPAQCLLRKCGWKAFNIKKNHWGEGEDAYAFRYRPATGGYR